MKYHSLGQYFYKLYALIFILILVPLAVFIFLYQAFRLEIVPAIGFGLSKEILSYLAIGLAFVVWLIAFLVFSIRLKALRKINSLGKRLSDYGTLTIVSNAIISLGMLILAGGYYLTENRWVTIIFIGSLIFLAFRWPFPKRVCKDLVLKGDEHMMVLYRMDSF